MFFLAPIGVTIRDSFFFTIAVMKAPIVVIFICENILEIVTRVRDIFIEISH